MTGGAAAAGPGATPPRRVRWLRRLLRHHDAVKNYVTAFAVLAAGLWTAWVFVALDTTAQARAELASLQQSPVANIALSVVPFAGDTTMDGGLVVAAELTNVGRRDAVLQFGAGPSVHVFPLAVADSGVIARGMARSFRLLAGTAEGDAVLPLPVVRLLPGERKRFEYVVPALSPGLYLVQFSVPVAPTDGNTGWHWTTRRYLQLCAGAATPNNVGNCAIPPTVRLVEQLAPTT